MATGSFWNLDDPDKPWGPFDPDAAIVFPIEVDAWLVSLGVGYSSHSIIVAAPLECESSAHSDGVIAVSMRLAEGAAYTPGTKYPFTLRIVGDDGFTQDDRTLYLKVKSR